MGILDWHRHTELMDRTYRWGMHEVARLKAEGHPVLGAGLGAEAARPATLGAAP